MLSVDVIRSWIEESELVEYAAGDLILDAFREPPDSVCLVLSGSVDLWVDAGPMEESDGAPRSELRIGPGEVFGLDATLTGKAIGPMALATGRVRVLRIPAVRVEAALAAVGPSQRTRPLRLAVEEAANPARFLTVDDLVETPPLVMADDSTIREVVRLMNERGGPGLAALEMPNNQFGVVTDRTLREVVLGQDLSFDAPAASAAVTSLPQVASGASAAEALVLLLDNAEADYVLMIDPARQLRGVIGPRDFIGSSVTAGATLHERIRRARSVGELQARARQLPELLADLLAGGLSTPRVLAIYSALVDSVTRQMLALIFASHPELSTEKFTWLSLGSNGRREATLTSDIDGAATFHGEPSQIDLDRYRAVFYEVTQCLAGAGMTSDDHGATAAHRLFSRSDAGWESSARGWVAEPAEGDAVMMISLLLDARPIHGDSDLAGVRRVFGRMRRAPGTMRLLLDESLAKRPRRPVRRLLAGRRAKFDVKKHALLPIVNLARWAGLSVGSAELSTGGRLAAAAGSPALPERQAAILIEVFEVLQSIRLHHQLRQVDGKQQPTDRLDLDEISPIDRSIIVRAVREISAVQQRVANISRYQAPEEWTRARTPVGEQRDP